LAAQLTLTQRDFDIEQYRGRPPWQIGDLVGEARIEVRGDTAWWVQRTYGTSGHLEDDVWVTEYSSLPQLAAWVLRQDGRAVPLEPEGLWSWIAFLDLYVGRKRVISLPPDPEIFP